MRGVERRPGRARPENSSFLCRSFVLPFISFLGGSGEKEKGGPYYDRLCRSVDRIKVMLKKPTAVAYAATEPLPWLFGPHIAGY